MAYLRSAEAEAWAWFNSARAKAEYAEALRFRLLKDTYRLEATAYPDLFTAVEQAKDRLGLQVPVTLYQSQRSRELNAALCYLPGEAHIILEGDVLRLLDPAELCALLGHELAHFLLWSEGDSRFLIADQLMQAVAADPRAEPSQIESARLLRLYTEIYADRGGLQVVGDPGPVITGLVKMQTGLPQVDAASYIRQADEVFARSTARTEEPSHPESFIRTRAAVLWAEGAANVETEVTRMIEGKPHLEKLDLLGQVGMANLTRRWLRALLEPGWFQTDAVRGHARLYFTDFEFPPEGWTDDDLFGLLRDSDDSIRDYLCYVLIDFCAVDSELEIEPLRAAMLVAGRVGWEDRVESLAIKELKINKAEARSLRLDTTRSDDAPSDA